MWQWRAWCAAEYIVDPDLLFGAQPSDLVSVLLRNHDDHRSADGGNATPRWRLLILEDSGEFLTLDAKERTGQALSRFLNVVDGLIGQGLRILVLVTSNEVLGRLHPAVSRPGRCVQTIRFHPFMTSEANAWLTRHGETPFLGDQARTLAELYARVHGDAEMEQRPAVGFVPSSSCRQRLVRGGSARVEREGPPMVLTDKGWFLHGQVERSCIRRV
jgi:hypothetical protein